MASGRRARRGAAHLRHDDRLEVLVADVDPDRSLERASNTIRSLVAAECGALRLAADREREQAGGTARPERMIDDDRCLVAVEGDVAAIEVDRPLVGLQPIPLFL